MLPQFRRFLLYKPACLVKRRRKTHSNNLFYFETVKIFVRIFQVIYCVYALLVFVALMIVVFVFIPFLFLFGKIRAGNLVYRVCRVWSTIWYFLIGIRHKEIYESPHDKSRQYIFVANHSSYMDVPSVVMCLHQPLRVLGKYEMVRYPIFGLIYRSAAILVDRSDPEHRAQSLRALRAAIARGISIFIFPEGTFNETGRPLKDFYDGAFRIAAETQTPIKPILFVDCIDRLHWRSIFSLNPGRCRSVFLKEIDVQGYSTTKQDTEKLKAIVYREMEEGLRRYRTYTPQP